MRPIPQTIEAVGELARYTQDIGLLDSLQQLSDRVQVLVPDCMGLSLCWVDEGVTFTVAASDEEIAVFDALQYLEAGPCTEAVRRGEGVATNHDELMSEAGWWTFAVATAAKGVRSSLTFPIKDQARTVGSVNLYGASDHAFDDLHQELADALGAWAPGAISNADLSFDSRSRAEAAPHVIRASREIDIAVGVLAERTGRGVDECRSRLEEAALAAHVAPEALARALLDLEG